MFNGDKTLRGKDEVVRYSKQNIEEIIKCQEDILYFAEHYFHIITLDEGKRLISLWDFQKKILKCLVKVPDDKKNVCLCASRQIGKSTMISVYVLWRILFCKEYRIALLANKEKLAMELLDRIKLAFSLLPKFLQVGVTEWNEKSISLENLSTIEASSTSSSAVRGLTLNELILDEFAFVAPNIQQKLTSSVIPTISSGKRSKVIMLSCVSDDTYVFTNEGIKQIKDFIQEDKIEGYEVPDYQVMGQNKIHSGNLMYNSGKAITNKIKTTSSMLECSEVHKLWACKDGVYGWYKSNELTIGDYISIKYGMNMWGNNDRLNFKSTRSSKIFKNIDVENITQDWAYFFGLLIAEGYCRKMIEDEKFVGGQVVITCGDDISEIFDRLNLKYSKKDKIHYSICSKGLVELIEYIGFDINKKSPKKIIPSRLLQMSKQNMIAMLQGLFDGDGFSRSDRGCVGYTSTSKELLMQVKMILLNLGILTDYYEHDIPPTKKVKVASHSYNVSANRHFSKLFYELVSFRIKRKQDKRIYLKDSDNFDYNGKDIIPYSKVILKKYFSFSKVFGHDVGVGGKRVHFSRDYLLDSQDLIFKNCNNSDLHDFFSKNISSDIKWEKIKSIEKSENKVYDFSLPTIEGDDWCHSVLYNGIVGHQTPNGLEMFANTFFDAIHDKNNYYAIKVLWNEVPNRDEAWKKSMISSLPGGDLQFIQEFDCKFFGAANTLVDNGVLEKIRPQAPIEFKWSGLVTIFENPLPNAKYIAGVDPSGGLKKNYSVIQILKVSGMKKLEQVAMFRSNTHSPYDLATFVIELSDYYNNCQVLVENNSDVGGILCSQLFHYYEFDRLIFVDGKMGIRSSKNTKAEGNYLLKRYIEHNWIKINDKTTIYELSLYKEQSLGCFASDRNCTDDTVTSLLWSLVALHLPEVSQEFFDDAGNVIEGNANGADNFVALFD